MSPGVRAGPGLAKIETLVREVFRKAQIKACGEWARALALRDQAESA